MAKFKVDWKQLFVEKGERVGLGVAGVLCVLMIVPMFWFMLFAPNSRAVSEELDKSAKQLKDKQASSTPDAADLPPPVKEGAKLVALERPKINSDDYPKLQVVAQETQVDKSKRLKPNVYKAAEGHVAVALMQLVSYDLITEGDKERILVLEGGGAAPMGMGPMAPPMGQDYYNRLRQQYQAPMGGGRRGGMGKGGGAMGGRMPYQSNPGAYSPVANARPEVRSKYIPVEQLDELGTNHPADTVQPVRMAVIVATFPYKRQIEEFRDKLHLKTDYEVVEETVEDTDPDNPPQKVQRNTFYFVSPLVERRVVDAHGTPLANAAWTPVDVEGNYRQLLRWNGMRFEEEPWELDALGFDGLTMQKLKAMGKNQYPDELKMNLTTLNSTVETLRKLNKPAIAKPKNPLDPSGFKVFSKQRIDVAGPGGLKMPPTSVPPPSGVNPNAADTYPEYCMIRLIDVDIHPGQYYEYRIKVRMGNPNFGMKDKVASPDFATSTEPLESDWFEIRRKDEKTQVVSVPSEYHLYPIDQKELEDRYSGQNFKATVIKDHQTVFQIHKWLQDTGPPSPVAVGEWSIAERVLAYRGEYIGRLERVEVPYWRSTQECFVLARESSVGKNPLQAPKGIVVDFGVPPTEGRTVTDYPILVDFEGGPMTWSRVIGTDDKGNPKKVSVNDTAGVETLILTPDGKLLAKNSWSAKADSERSKRLEDWRTRIKDVREGKATGNAGPMDDPFGKPKMMP